MTDRIVMIHGMWGGGWYWEHYRRFFEEKGYQCDMPTLRYHDVSPGELPDPRLSTTGLLDYAHDLQEQIYGYDEKPILMGHSMGGLLAQILGARGLAKALVLLTPASPSGINALTYSVVKSFWSVLTRWGFWRKSNQLSYNASSYAMLHRVPEPERKALYEKFVYESGRAAFEIGFWLMDFKRAAQVEASQVTCPVLVIAGAEDRITPASVVEKVARRYPLSTFRKFDNHAHWVVGEPGWEEIAIFTAEWLEGMKAIER
jgi:non-heme chloroperoxidase